MKFILFWELIYFFLLLNYQNIATERILKFVLKNLFWSMRMSSTCKFKIHVPYRNMRNGSRALCTRGTNLPNGRKSARVTDFHGSIARFYQFCQKVPYILQKKN